MNSESTSPDGRQRREDVRVHACLPVELSARVISLSLFRNTGREAGVISGKTTTISGGGLAILHHEAVPVGTSFNVKLQLPDSPGPLTMKAKVVRCRLVRESSDGQVFDLGLTFTRIAEAARSRIVSHVFKVQRMTTTENARKKREEETMPQVIPEQFLDLFQQPSFANLATIMSDGSPQVTPVWCDYDGRYVIINTAKGRVKDRNMRKNPRVAMAIMDPKNPYRYLEIRGKVAEITESGADEHIDKMAKKYMNVEKYPYRSSGEVRVLYKIAPERVSSMG